MAVSYGRHVSGGQGGGRPRSTSHRSGVGALSPAGHRVAAKRRVERFFLRHRSCFFAPAPPGTPRTRPDATRRDRTRSTERCFGQRLQLTRLTQYLRAWDMTPIKNRYGTCTHFPRYERVDSRFGSRCPPMKKPPAITLVEKAWNHVDGSTAPSQMKMKSDLRIGFRSTGHQEDINNSVKTRKVTPCHSELYSPSSTHHAGGRHSACSGRDSR